MEQGMSWARAEKAWARIEGMLKLRYLGVGLVWAWLYCAYGTGALLPNRDGQGINTDGSWLVSAVAVVVAFFALGWLLGRGGNRAPKVSEAAASATALSVGTVLTAVGGQVGGPFLWAAGIFTGIGYASLSILWVMALVRLDVEELELVVPLAALVVIPCVLVFPSLTGAPGVLGTTALPLVSGFLLLRCLRDGASGEVGAAGATVDVREEAASRESQGPFAGGVIGVEHAAGGRGTSRARRPWLGYLVRISCLLCLAFVAVGWQSALVDQEVALHSLLNLDISSLVSNGSTVVLAAMLVLFSRKVSFSSLFRWVFPALIVSLVLFMQPGGTVDFTAAVLSATCDTLCQTMLFLYVTTLAKTHGVSGALAVGLVNGALQLGVLAGNVLGAACLSGSFLLSPTECGFMLVGVLAVATIAVPQCEPGLPAPEEGNAPDANARLRRLFQETYGLSEREVEVALLLAQGRSRPYIREQLFISKNTVATHIKHIYAKLDVHSKEELIDLVKAEKGGFASR